MFNAKLIQVIVTEIEQRGDGTKESPIRRVTQYWSTDGKLLAERDPFPFTDIEKISCEPKP